VQCISEQSAVWQMMARRTRLCSVCGRRMSAEYRLHLTSSISSLY